MSAAAPAFVYRPCNAEQYKMCSDAKRVFGCPEENDAGAFGCLTAKQVISCLKHFTGSDALLIKFDTKKMGSAFAYSVSASGDEKAVYTTPATCAPLTSGTGAGVKVFVPFEMVVDCISCPWNAATKSHTVPASVSAN